MQIGWVTQGHRVKCGEQIGRFLRMSGSDAIIELDNGKRVMWSGATEVEVLSEVEEVQVSVIPRLEAELARLEAFTEGKYAKLGLTATTPCIWLPKQLHPPLIRGALGKQPVDAILCRRCNDRLCINAEHLFWGTRSDCQRDMVLKGLAKPSGKAVTAEQVSDRILKLRARLTRLREKVAK